MSMRKAWKLAGIRAVFFLFWALIMAIPVYGPFMGGLEGRFFPVTGNVVMKTLRHVDGGLIISYSFTKYRQCEFVGMSAEKKNNQIAFFPLHRTYTHGVGEGQDSGLWHLGAIGLDGVSLFMIHRCTPMWLTITKVLGD